MLAGQKPPSMFITENITEALIEAARRQDVAPNTCVGTECEASGRRGRSVGGCGWKGGEGYNRCFCTRCFLLFIMKNYEIIVITLNKVCASGWKA